MFFSSLICCGDDKFVYLSTVCNRNNLFTSDYTVNDKNGTEEGRKCENVLLRKLCSV